MVTDRLTGLSEFISDQLICLALNETREHDRANAKITHDIMLWVVLAMGVLTELPLRIVFKHARRMRPGEPTPPRNTLCYARQRLGVAPLRWVFENVVRRLANDNTPGPFYKRLRMVGFDATCVDIPDSEENARVFGRPSGGRGDGAFPQVTKLSLVELGTHAEPAFVLGSYGRSEHVMAWGLRKRLDSDMLLLCDRNFFSYRLWKELDGRGVRMLFRLKEGMILDPIEEFSDGSYEAKIYANGYDCQKDRNGIVVRVIKYTLDDPQRTGQGEEHVLLTNLHESQTYPAKELAVLYHERWEQELVFDEQKTHHDPKRPTKPTQLRSHTPAGVVQEM